MRTDRNSRQDSTQSDSTDKKKSLKTTMAQLVIGVKPEEDEDVQSKPSPETLSNLTEQIQLKKSTISGMASRAYSSVKNTIPEHKGNTRAILPSDFVINGDIKAGGDVEISGIINGNIEIQGHITLNGVINGNVSAKSANFETGKITGESVTIKEDVSIGKDFELTAKVTAQNMDVNGAINGNIEATDNITIGSNARITGDIVSGAVAMEKGASFIGNMKISEKNK